MKLIPWRALGTAREALAAEFLCLLAILFGSIGCVGSERLDPTPATLVGAWSGDARAVVAWAREQRIPIALAIAGDGRVSGTVGGAKLVGGYLAVNRGSIGRTLDINSDYIVRAELQGVVVPGEPVASRVLFLPFDLVDGEGSTPRVEGGLTTCESARGSGKDVAVAASRMKLTRSGPR